MKLSSTLHGGTAMYKDVLGECWSSCLTEGNNSCLSLVSFGRVLFCVLLLWRKKSRLSIWLSLEKVATTYFQACVVNCITWAPCCRLCQASLAADSPRSRAPLKVSGGVR